MPSFAKAVGVAMVVAALTAAARVGNAALADPSVSADTLIVSTGWVAERLSSENLVLLHVGNRAEYDATHIPGARYISLSMIGVRDENGLFLQMPPVAQLDSVFESLGVSDDSRIVVYFGKDWATPTARVFLTLDYLGLGSRASILDGGMPAWTAEGRPVTAEIPTPKRGALTPQPRQDVVAHADWLAANLEKTSVAVIDARTSNFYSGARGGHGMPRAGHIAGAQSIPFPTVLDDETLKFKNVDTLREMFRAAGAEPGDTVVTYCHIGQQASLVYLTARSLGYAARMYDGSFQEWSNREDLPVVNPAAQTRPKLITTADLSALLERGGASVVDMRSELFDYLEGHIPGAAYLHYESLRATSAGVPGDLLPAESYASLFSQLGLSLERPVVIYGWGDRANFNATFLAWILGGFGHPDVRLLDGGYSKWAAEGKPISRSYPDAAASEFPDESFDPNLARLDMVRWVVERAGTPDGEGMVIVDVRPTDQFTGRAGAQVRRGRIPGAVNHVWSSDLTDGGASKVWKSVEKLRASYEAQGITPDKHVILYCNTGTEASHVFFALRNLLGYPNVDVYFPSWTEWSEREELPIETGDPT